MSNTYYGLEKLALSKRTLTKTMGRLGQEFFKSIPTTEVAKASISRRRMLGKIIKAKPEIVGRFATSGIARETGKPVTKSVIRAEVKKAFKDRPK